MITGPRQKRAVMKALGADEIGNMSWEDVRKESKYINKRNIPEKVPDDFIECYNRVVAEHPTTAENEIPEE